eukprot:CAMPEP_0196745688 /NCGR_PEP_ID=MMETSP1091-20130531/62737_1 /TAXON_ID=302021 /ORGANISM="Rhodomonas sp., Strain CCMP768" /LENGTH=303 /DNA_ID=CAMNT_0042092503 /DNA_START=6 /DNA_END=917 /DNA_ORIENTATION=+
MATPTLKVLLFTALVGSPSGVMAVAAPTVRALESEDVKMMHVVESARQRQANPLQAPSSASGEVEARVFKSVIFAIDISGSMGMLAPMNAPSASAPPLRYFILQEAGAGSAPKLQTQRRQHSGPMNRLQVCKLSLLQAVENVIREGDQFGLYVFDHHFEARHALQRADTNFMATMERIVSGIDTRGGTAFWDAVKTSMELMKMSAQHDDRWIIALTDGEDQHSKPESFPWILQNIRTITVNLVIITVACRTATYQLKQIKECADSSALGNKVMHIEANNDEIAQAFGKVEEMLGGGGGLSENL